MEVIKKERDYLFEKEVAGDHYVNVNIKVDKTDVSAKWSDPSADIVPYEKGQR